MSSTLSLSPSSTPARSPTSTTPSASEAPAPPSASASAPAPAWTYSGARTPAWAINPPAPPRPKSAINEQAQDAPATTNGAGASVASAPGQHQQSVPPPPPPSMQKARKRKHRTIEEHTLMKETAAKLAALLAADTQATLHPDTENPFEDAEDVVRRLLPYHIWQHPHEDLEALRWPANGKGKGRASETELATAELAETKFAIECEKRRRKLEADFRRISTRQGTRGAPDDIMYTLAQSMLESERSDGVSLTVELRGARAALEQAQREQKMRGAPSLPPPAPTAVPAPYGMYPPYMYAAAYAGNRLANASGSSDGSAAYGAQLSTPPTPASASMPLYTSAPVTALGAGWSRAPSAQPSTASSPAPPPATLAVPAAPTTAPPVSAAPVPVQLPVTALPALAQLGITPVPTTALVPGALRPQCVLAGVYADGNTLALEINVGSLTPTQRHGLAVLLGSIMTGRVPAGASRTGSAGSVAATPAAASPAASTSGAGE